MINIEKCINEFTNYVKNYNLEDEKIFLKYEHTFRVENYSKQIAKSLKLSEEDVKLASLIGILHDIGRFEQVKRYDTFDDSISVDHAKLGIEILLENNYINKYVEDENAKSIVVKAIENHNKLSIEEGIDERTLMFCKIIRDADKLDIFYILLSGFDKKKNNEPISFAAMEDFKSLKSVLKKDVKSSIDLQLFRLSWFFDIYFPYSFKIIDEQKFVENIIEMMYKNYPDYKFEIDEVNNIIKKYINKKMEEIEC